MLGSFAAHAWQVTADDLRLLFTSLVRSSGKRLLLHVQDAGAAHLLRRELDAMTAQSTMLESESVSPHGERVGVGPAHACPSAARTSHLTRSMFNHVLIVLTLQAAAEAETAAQGAPAQEHAQPQRRPAPLAAAADAALERFNALLACGSSGADAAGQGSPILPALHSLHRLLQGLQPPAGADSAPILADAPGWSAAVFVARAMDDLLRVCFEPRPLGSQASSVAGGPPQPPSSLSPAASDAAGSPHAPAAASEEARLRETFNGIVGASLAEAAVSALRQQLHASRPAEGLHAGGTQTSQRSAGGTQSGTTQPAWGSTQLEANAALEAADAGLSRAHGAGEPEEAGGLDWLDEEALQQSAQAGMPAGTDLASWDGAAQQSGGVDGQLQPFFDFDEADSQAGDALEGVPGQGSSDFQGLQPQANGSQELEPYLAFDDCARSPADPWEPDLASAQAISSGSARTFDPGLGLEEVALEPDALEPLQAPGTAGTGEVAAAFLQPGRQGGAGTSRQAQRPEQAPEQLSEGAAHLLAAMAAAVRSCGACRILALQRAAAEEGLADAPQRLAAARAALAEYEWMHEPVLAAGGMLGAPVDAPPPV